MWEIERRCVRRSYKNFHVDSCLQCGKERHFNRKFPCFLIWFLVPWLLSSTIHAVKSFFVSLCMLDGVRETCSYFLVFIFLGFEFEIHYTFPSQQNLFSSIGLLKDKTWRIVCARTAIARRPSWISNHKRIYYRNQAQGKVRAFTCLWFLAMKTLKIIILWITCINCTLTQRSQK